MGRRDSVGATLVVARYIGGVLDPAFAIRKLCDKLACDMSHKVLFFGPPGAGKDTQAALLAQRLDVPCISVGDLCRREVEMQSELADYIDGYMARGLIVPGVARVLVREQMLQHELAKTGYVLVGYCRTLPTLHDFLTWETPTHVVHLVASDAIVTDRLLQRGRSDDHADAIATRIRHYHDNEVPVCNTLRESTNIAYREIDGSEFIENTAEKVYSFVTV